ncbi:MAG: Nucleoid-associated protein [Alphaproteobacteria bacterium MarineAlpha6_Bin5]|nr:MAG: Nucleoid-associated protein [Alphaproteobacteria bacterium MarineAlpha6_Bin5]
MMKKAQEMQKKMQEMQESLSSLEVEGTSGGGMVKVVMNCKNEIKKIDIDQSIINKDEKEVMEDLVVAALNDAKTKAEEKSQEEMKKLTGGLGLPPDMKMPF